MALEPAASLGKPRWTGYVEPEPGLGLPCTIIHGRAPGPKLLVTAGVHGAEYTSIEAARRLCRLAADAFVGQLTILPVVNIGAFFQHRAFRNPADEKNVNRVFPGDPKGTASDRLAHWLVTTAMAGMDGYIDLHGGDIVEALIPFAIFPDSSPRSSELAIASGLPFAVRSFKRGHSYGAAADLGIPAVLLEAGQNGLVTEESVGLLEDGVKGIMAELGMMAKANQPKAKEPRLCRMEVAMAPDAGFWHAEVKPGGVVEKGKRVGIIRDLVGEWEKPILAEHSGPVLYNLTSLAVNKGQSLIGIAV
ncbi:MAG: succinylglutamate desuccinylase/aspartoacylase family protein [Proteobacteria bacterium]|nr:succinylglutamate desuccinylase/aspartoacylase family protein [Pseudomonadota bacterium]